MVNFYKNMANKKETIVTFTDMENVEPQRSTLEDFAGAVIPEFSTSGGAQGTGKKQYVGDLYSNFGRFGGNENYWTIGENDLYATYDPAGNLYFRAGKTDFDDTSAGFVLGVDSGTPKFYIGDDTNSLLWNGSTLAIIGSVTADSGVIGGWTIAATTLTGGDCILDSTGIITLGTGNDIITLDATDATYRLAIGHATYASAPFSVTKAGAVKAESGIIGGFTLAATTLTSTDLLLDAMNQRIKLGNGNDIVIFDAADATDRIGVGHSIIGYCPFKVSKTGAITATQGNLGGWTLAATTLTSASIILDSGNQRITLGIINDIIILDAIDATYRLGIGHYTIGSCPFKVSKEGAVTATSGTVGGWTLGSTTLTGGNCILNNAGTITLGTGNDIIILDAADATYRLAVGHATYASAPFSVTKAGAVKAESGIIGGWTLGSTTLTATSITLDAGNQKITVGSGSPNISIDGANAKIESSNYVSGVFGAGFHLSSNLLEIGNIAARGIIRTAVFQKDVISAIGGNFAVLDSDVLNATMTAADNSTLTIEGNTTFTVGDLLRIKDGTDDEWFEITNIGSAPTYTVVRDKAADYVANTNPAWPKGATVVNYGQSGDGGVYLTASDTNAPYMEVFDHAGSPWTTVTTRLRVGNLNGYLGYAADIYGLGIGQVGANKANLTFDNTNGIRMRINTTTVFQIDNAGAATVTGMNVRSASSGARIEMLPDSDTGLQIIDDDGNDIFTALVGGANVGDVTIGSSAGANFFFDKSTGNISFQSANSGARIVFDQDKIEIYDSNGLSGRISNTGTASAIFEADINASTDGRGLRIIANNSTGTVTAAIIVTKGNQVALDIANEGAYLNTHYLVGVDAVASHAARAATYPVVRFRNLTRGRCLTLASGSSATGETLNVEHQTYGTMMNLLQTCHSVNACYGIKMNIANTGAGAEHAFKFDGSEMGYTAAGNAGFVSNNTGTLTVVGYIKIDVGGNTYYMPYGTIA